jgi:hypothetical protein
MKKYTILIVVQLIINTGYSQNFPPVSYTSNLVNPKLLVKDDISKVEHDSLGILFMKENFIKDSTKIIAILSFIENGHTFSIWKIIQKGKNENLLFLNKNNVISKAKGDSYLEIINVFSKIKIEVFRELLFANGEFKSKGFKDLHDKSRGNFGLMNISKLNSEIIKNNELYYELLE